MINFNILKRLFISLIQSEQKKKDVPIIVYFLQEINESKKNQFIAKSDFYNNSSMFICYKFFKPISKML